MIYLASPYSHPDPAVREQRYQAACQATAALLRAGELVFSPIVHSHPLVAFDLPTAWGFWESIDRAYLERCDEVVVLMLNGWEASVGVRAEIGIARALGKPVRVLAPEDATGSPTSRRRGTVEDAATCGVVGETVAWRLFDRQAEGVAKRGSVERDVFRNFAGEVFREPGFLPPLDPERQVADQKRGAAPEGSGFGPFFAGGVVAGGLCQCLSLGKASGFRGEDAMPLAGGRRAIGVGVVHGNFSGEGGCVPSPQLQPFAGKRGSEC